MKRSILLATLIVLLSTIVYGQTPEITSIELVGTTVTEGSSEQITLKADLSSPADLDVILPLSFSDFQEDFAFEYDGLLDLSTLITLDQTNATDFVFGDDGVLYYSTGQNVYKVDKDDVETIIYNGSTNAISSGFIWSIDLDPDGNLIVSDQMNSSILRVTPDGTVTKISGGDSGFVDGNITVAQFDYPTDVRVDKEGNIFINDGNNNRIRKIDLEGNVSSVAEIDYIRAMDLDQDGNLWFTDGYKIQVLTTDGEVVTRYGNGSFYTEDGNATAVGIGSITSLVVVNNNIFFYDDNAYQIRQIDQLGNLTTLAGSGSQGVVDGNGLDSQIEDVESLRSNALGDLILLDEDDGDGHIRRLQVSAKVLIDKGETSGSIDFSAINDIIYLEPEEAVTVTIGEPENAILSSSVTQSFDFSVVDDDDELADITFTYDSTLVINESGESFNITGNLDGIAGVDVQVDFLFEGTAILNEDFEITSESLIISAGDTTGSITITPIQEDLVEAIESIQMVIDTVIHANSAVDTLILQLVDDDQPTITSITQEGSEVTEGRGDEVILSATIDDAASFDVAISLNNNTPEQSGDIRYFYPGFGTVSTLVEMSAASRGMVTDANGNIYVANASRHTIDKIDSEGNVSIFAGSSYNSGSADASDPLDARFNRPTGITIDADGNLYVTDHNNHTIRKITSDGVVSTLAGSAENSGDVDGTGSVARFSSPRAITIGSDNSLYVADKSNHKIRRVTLDGEVTTWAGSGTEGSKDGSATEARLSSPANVYALNNDELLVADKRNGRLRKISASGDVSTIGNYLERIQGIVEVNGEIIVSTTATGKLYRLVDSEFEVLTGDDQGAIDGSLDEARFNYIYDLKLGSDGRLYALEAAKIRVLDFTLKILVPAGETSGDLTIVAVNDTETEETETVELEISAVTGADYTVGDTFSFEVIDDEFVFTEVDNSIPGLDNASIGWADYDRDGDKDIAIMGSSNTEGRVLRIYRNDEAIFLNSNQNLTNMSDGDLAWVDINNDGFVDLVTMGIASGETRLILYLNESGNSFIGKEDHGIEPLSDGKMEWGDFDNDGLKDLVLTGLDANNSLTTKLYRSLDGQGNFQLDEGFGEAGIINGDIRIVDFELDGDKDLIYMGEDLNEEILFGYRINSLIDPADDNYFSEVNNRLKNSTIEFVTQSDSTTILLIMGEDENGSTQFQSVYINLDDNVGFIELANSTFLQEVKNTSRFKNGDMALADANNDGRLDLIISGEDEDGSPNTHVWFSSDAGHKLVDFGLRDLRNSSVDWIDYDGDGDLDIFISGTDQNGNVSLIYQNNLIESRANSKPNPPTDLEVEDLGNGNVRFQWTAGEDDYSDQLGFNLRIGTSTGEAQILNPASDLTSGDILIQEVALTDNSFYETNLPPGTYYWSVQSQDDGFRGSEFAEEQSFTILYEWQKLNLGGIVDRRLPGTSNGILEFFDVDYDGDMDILYVRDGSRELYLNDNQTFRPFRFDNYSETIGATIGDLNGDGFSDFVFVEKSDNSFRNRIYFGIKDLAEIDFSNDNERTFDYFEVFEDSDYGLANPRLRILDVNNDGSNDLIIAGSTSEFSNGVPKLYMLGFQDFSQTFVVDLSDQIAQLSDAEFDFGDLDNDQDIDFIITGFDDESGITSVLYFNETSGTSTTDVNFVATDDNLSSTIDGTVDLIDFDGDGDLDVIFTGTSKSGSDVFELYENRESEAVRTFVNVSIGLDRIRESKIDLGDFNGDGYSDLLFSGLIEGAGRVTRLAEYNPDTRSYENSDFDVSSILNAEVEFGDLDGDGDLDFMLTGEDAGNSQQFLFDVFLNVRNESAVASSATAGKFLARLSNTEEFAVNERPEPPTSLADPEVVDLGNETYEVTLNWEPGSDDTTPTDGLSYALKVGTTQGADDILNANANADGFRRKTGKGNVEHNTGWKLILPEGTYHWAVQSLDASYNGSDFIEGATIIAGEVQNQAPLAEDQEFEIAENSEVGTEVGTIEASDPEAGELTFTISSGNAQGAFALDEDTGLLTVADSEPLNYELTSNFQFTVDISDSEGLITTINVIVNLLDVDDGEMVNEFPISENQQFEFNENPSAGFEIGFIEATDPEGGSLTYNILIGNEDGAFDLEENTGRLSVAMEEQFDFEVQSVWELEVEIMDSVSAGITITVTVNLLNVDETVNESPISENQQFEFDENPPAGFEIGFIEATDPEGGSLTYNILTGNEDGAFDLEENTGRLSVAMEERFDFEMQSVWELEVEIVDSVSASITITVTVNLLDLEETNNVPTVINDQTFRIAEGLTNGSVVGTIVYSDEDCCTPEVTLMSGNTDGAFIVDLAGEIKVANSTALDIDINPQFELEIQVDDLNGGISTGMVTILLDPVLSVPSEIEGLKIHPNPASYSISLSNINPSWIGKPYIITDMTGKVVLKGTLDTVDQEIQLWNQKAGVYFFSIEGQHSKFLKK
ncbi:MAG: cadherin domain-containing protein [Cytophagales bacterium]|nr:cadherin domain-containing protein [Cytophagales bacterium]